MAQRGAAAHAERAIDLVAQVAGAEQAVRAAIRDRADAVDPRGPDPLLALVIDAVVAALQVAADRRVAPEHLRIEAKDAVIVAVAVLPVFAVEPGAEIVARIVGPAVEQVDLKAIALVLPRGRGEQRSRIGLRVSRVEAG